MNFYALPEKDWKLLTRPPFSILDKFIKMEAAVQSNADIAEKILSAGLASFGFDASLASPRIGNYPSPATANDMTKVAIIINQFYRDWSAEGATERTAQFGPVMADVGRIFADVEDKGEVKILVPGVGLGRLLVDLCCEGFNVEGNEISYHALIASNWMLNHSKAGEKFALYPWVGKPSNQINLNNYLQKVVIPDVHPETLLRESSKGKKQHAFERLKMTASDFIVNYLYPDNANKFDAVVTVFFIDTAPNVLRYMETIWHTLRPGGHWINVGPLMWHWPDGSISEEDDMATADGHIPGIEAPGSVELTMEELMNLVKYKGFEVEVEEQLPLSAGYIQQHTSMFLSAYAPMHFVAKKPSK